MLFASGAMGFKGEQSFMFEQLEVEACNEGAWIFKCGDLFEIGAKKQIKCRGCFARHLRAQNRLGKSAGCLQIRILSAQVEVLIEDCSIDKASQTGSCFSVDELGLAKSRGESQ